ncbi:lipoyl synthase [Tahibacter harae]|uniref:Lipoyl synthase n=1 Tax=Tahibacter harae TaxID=2963937 RepID=A0ABT1QWC3_9GAMM|nr:lipoyl synthase [Tahibacter harae]MCQ4166585.1 lipoyl synthase [Tahibacter harae]
MDTAPSKAIPIVVVGEKQLGEDKIARNRAVFDQAPRLRKPDWIRVRIPPGNAVAKLKAKLRENRLVTVCEEASCPNIHECFGKGTATFMILGEVCTRRCSFCDVAHGRPKPPDPHEPRHLAETIRDMALRYVVITSVDRDDLRDGGAQHFADCIRLVREQSPSIQIEILTPDFRGKGRMERALEILATAPPDVFNHNLETVRELYREVRPGADYDWSLDLLRRFKAQHPSVPTKSGIMLGLGETFEQVEGALNDLRAHDVDMVTIGQYLQPTPHHHPVIRYWTPDEFKALEELGYRLGFQHVASGPMVRSSYHADEMAHAAGIAQSA